MAPATPSTAPQVDTTGGYVTGAYDNDGFTQWMQGDMVQYAVTFVNAAGESNFSAWSSWVQVGASICAGVNIPTDPSGAATSRNLYRKFQSSQTPERVLTILDNTTTHVFDTVAAVNFDPPAQAPEYPLDPSQFAARSNFP